MRKIARFKIVILALMLAVSHAVLVSHVTAHFTPGLEQCELCVSQSQLFSAIHSPEQFLEVEPGFGTPWFELSQCTLQAAPYRIYHQRAPPPPSA